MRKARDGIRSILSIVWEGSLVARTMQPEIYIFNGKHFMKFRFALLILLTTVLSACNFTLAEDVTPPPGYVPPTPLPTLVLSPAQAPRVENGAAIYVTKCAPCHGDTGLGDGPQGIQLGVTVPAFALPDIARPLSPAQMYTTVTRGNIERFMPPFASLSDQERWDVVAYITTLHTTQEEIQKGKDLFEANCAGCSTDYYKNQTKMSELSTVALARIIRLGNDEIKAFGENLPDADMWAVAEYLRSLSFDASPLARATVAPTTQASTTSGANTSSTDGTVTGRGNVTGTIENKTGKDIPSDMAVTLHGFDHDTQNPSSTGPVEVLTLEGTVNADGTFLFENVEMPENRIFTAEVTYDGIGIKSDFGVVTTGQSIVSLPAITLQKTTRDTSALVVQQLHMFVDSKSADTYDVLAIYTILNSSDAVIAVSMGAQQEIPFLQFPTGSTPLGYQDLQEGAILTVTSDGFAMPPNDKPYGILAYSSVVKAKETTIVQPLLLPVTSANILVPDGMEIKGNQLTKGAPQDLSGVVYQMYTTESLKVGDSLTFTVSGSPKASSSTDTSTSGLSGVNGSLLIGVGGLGIALILAGAWTFLRDRKKNTENDDEEDIEFESPEDVMDAIIALDDLHRAKKISEEAYQKRRSELKEILKEMV